MPRKRSSNSGYRKKLYLGIVDYIIQHGKLPNTNLSKTAFQYHLNKLKLDGIIKKIGYAVWTADKDRLEQLKFQQQVQKQHRGTKHIRGHGFHWKIDIPNIPLWSKRKDYLDRNKILYTESQANWEGYKLLIKGYKCWLFNNSIIIYSPKGKSFFNYTAKDSLVMAFNDLRSVLVSLSNKLNIDFTFNNKYKITVCKQHFAKIRDTIAKYYNDRGLKLECRNDSGEIWLLVDKSFKLDELEFVHSKTAQQDTDNAVMPFFNGLKEHFESTGESLTLNGIMGLIKLQQDQIGQLTSTVNSLIYKKPEPLGRRDNYFG